MSYEIDLICTSLDDESLADKLRNATARELSNNDKHYMEHPHVLGVAEKLKEPVDVLWQCLLGPDSTTIVNNGTMQDALRHEISETSTSGRWSSMLHVLALSNILQKDILSVYPCIGEFLFRPLLHARIKPSRKCLQNAFSTSDKHVVIMWSRDGALNQNDMMFTPNHIVPLVSLPNTPPRACASQRKRTESNPPPKKQAKLMEFFKASEAKKKCTVSDAPVYEAEVVLLLLKLKHPR